MTAWEEFSDCLRTELACIGHEGLVLVRNFDRITFSNEHEEVDRLKIAIETGTDRDSISSFWNAEGHDHEHDLVPRGKNPEEIIYAYVVDAFPDPYLVHIGDTPEQFDVTEGLNEHVAILVYNPDGLERKSKNEHWFIRDPRESLLMIFTVQF